MSRDDIVNAKQALLYESLLFVTDAETAADIALRDMLPKSPTDKRKAAWAEEYCAQLSRRLDEDAVKAARMACHCRPPLSKFARLKRAYAASGDLAEYVSLQNELNAGARFYLEGDAVYMSYPTCYCGFVKNAGRPLPKSWCYCTIGYAKAVHDYIFGRDTNVELLQSVISGDEQCLMRITLSGEADAKPDARRSI